VGRTAADPGNVVVASDHPHARGENYDPDDETQIEIGPSPRTWGERIKAIALQSGWRTIPTHVGRTRGDGGTVV